MYQTNLTPLSPEIQDWLDAPGDLDDFLFYPYPKPEDEDIG